MAKIINDLPSNASQALIKAAEESLQQPEESVFRVTSLIDSPLIRTLTIKHWDELEIPLSKCISALHGTAWHAMMAKYAPENSEVEKKLTMACHKLEGYTVSGTPDEFSADGELIDHKTCKTYKYIDKDFESWEQQLNIYALMKRLQGLDVKTIAVYAAFTDWSKYKRMQGGDSYPARRALRIQQNLWSTEEQTAFVAKRLKDHLEHPVRECTKKEKWQSDTTYALKKTGRKTALKVEPSIDSLHSWSAKKGLNLAQSIYSIETRPGQCTRCEDWCTVSKFCPFYKEQE